jgi:hypothetical protein
MQAGADCTAELAVIVYSGELSIGVEAAALAELDMSMVVEAEVATVARPTKATRLRSFMMIIAVISKNRISRKLVRDFGVDRSVCKAKGRDSKVGLPGEGYYKFDSWSSN